jgi:signal peptidase I
LAAVKESEESPTAALPQAEEPAAPPAASAVPPEERPPGEALAKERPGSPRPAPPRVRDYAEALIIAVIFAIFVRTFVVQAFKIPTGSMEDNLLVGDHILVNKFIYAPTAGPIEEWLLPVRDVRRGDVVVFKYPDDPTRDFIKRCVGLPGDEVELIDKRLHVNGELVEDRSYTLHSDERVYSRSSYLPPSYSRRDNFGPFLVPPESYFCLGDNRDNSRDSRFWRRTTVPEEYLKGRALLIYWSFDPERARRGTGNPWERLERFAGSTRGERTFDVVR